MNAREMTCSVVRALVILLGLVLAGPGAAVAAMQCVDFEDLTLGHRFALGEVFVDSDVQIEVEQIRDERGKLSLGTGLAVVVDATPIGGSGLGVSLDPFNLHFHFSGRMSGLTARFQMDDGVGPVNLEINGEYRWAERVRHLNGATIGDVEVAVYGGGQGEPSLLRLSGTINDLVIGGFGLTLDNVCPVVSGPSVFFTDQGASPGSVLEYRADLDTTTAVYTRDSGSLGSFAFAPWDPHRLYFTPTSGNVIYEVALDSSRPVPAPVYTHTTYIKDIAFDSATNLYFSEASGGAADGIIWKLELDGTVSHFMTVPLTSVYGFWRGAFAFAPDGTLYLANGNTSGAQVYRVDAVSGSVEPVFGPVASFIDGIAFSTWGTLYCSDFQQTILQLDLATGTAVQVYHDRSLQNISDVQVRDLEPPPPVVDGIWVMPYGITNLRFDQIDAQTGLVDYTDATSGMEMFEAPFGGTLVLRMSRDSELPTDALYYYRWRYRLAGTTAWNDLTAPVNVHYVKNRPDQTPVFPLLQLGPVEIGSMNLYRFRPHEDELPALVTLGPGESAEWPAVPLSGDYARGVLNTASLAPGQYELRFDVYDSAGIPATPGVDYELVLPAGVDSDGTIITVTAPVMDGGTQRLIAVDNRACTAAVIPPVIDTATTNSCGFLQYASDRYPLELAWDAWHPAGHGRYILDVIKGQSSLDYLLLVPPDDPAKLPFIEELSSSAHNANGVGGFSEESPIIPLLDGCPQAAFAVDLHVLAKATTGNGHRISAYDAYASAAFAVAPE